MKNETPIIRKLRRRFIALAMASLVVLLSLIVTGMNIINYNEVVRDADERIEVIEENTGRMKFFGEDDFENFGDVEEFLFGRGGRRGPFMTRDEAEESRFFTVVMDESNNVVRVNIDRISAVDASDAAEYAVQAADSGKESGFIDDFRYHISKSSTYKTIIFLDCGRVLDSYRDFLRASILMSLLGLLIVFAVIVYFSGRIVKPVAESYEKQKRFITDAGHEMKTPLAIIKANLDVIEMDPDSTEECLEDIGEQVDRLSTLTEDLVYLSRMEEAGESLVMTEVPLSDIVSETAESFDALANERGKIIEKDIEPMISVEGSNKELEKLVSILVENAVKYSSEEDPINLSLKRDGRDAVLRISNKTYEEVSNEDLAHVFERFYRNDSSRSSVTGGYGIGLSMAAAIVNAHKGRITANTTDGTDFIVSVAIPQVG